MARRGCRVSFDGVDGNGLACIFSMSCSAVGLFPAKNLYERVILNMCLVLLLSWDLLTQGDTAVDFKRISHWLEID
jgi:hypothetical protein